MSRIISVIGAHGGCGKTFVTLNLAYALKSELNSSVLVLDSNSPLSCHAREVLVDLDAPNYFDDYLSVTTNTPHKTSDFQAISHNDIDYLSLFSGKHAHFFADKNNRQRLQSNILDLALDYDYLLIDGIDINHILHSQLLDISSDIILIAQADALSVSRLVQMYDFIQSKNYSTQIIKIVINKLDSNSAVTEDWLYAQMGASPKVMIPRDNMPYPFMASNPKVMKKSAIGKLFVKLILNLGDVSSDYNVLSLHRDSQQHSNQVKRDLKDEIQQLKLSIHNEILDLLDLKRMNVEVENDPKQMAELENKVRYQATKILDKTTSFKARDLREDIIDDVVREVLGLGPLEVLLENEHVSEIMVNDWQTIYIEQRGQLTRSELSFISDKQLMRIVERIVAPLGRRIDISSPMVDARLRDGSRVNVIIPPLAPKGAILTIRKFSKVPLSLENLIDYGSLNRPITLFLQAAVKSKLNVIISGGTGTGKTSLLNILSSFIPENQRVVTVEDSAELQLRQPHVLTLESRPPNIEGKGEVTIRDLVKNSLRMRPDRIVVGECRSGEALDMLQAMNTGHDGSMTTVHANSASEMLNRLETLVMYAGTDLPSRAIREQIKSAVDIVVQITRFKDGSRKVTQVTEVTGISQGEISMEDVFLFEQKGVNEENKIFGNFISSGYIPQCLERFEADGNPIAKELFWA